MFDRQKYKRFAKVQLQNRWLPVIFITLFTAIISSFFSIPDYMRIYNSDGFKMLLSGQWSLDTIRQIAEAENSLPANQTFLLSMVQLIIAEILEVAALNVYLKMTRSPDKVPFSAFIEGFNNWGRAVLGILWQFLWVLLWSFLFVIPGIIKYIAYSQMFFIIAEYDNVSVTKAMRISMIITKGHKWELFVMGLSFIGWILLGIITLHISDLFVTPYMKLSFVNAYHGMLKEAVETGRIRPEDLTE